MAAIILSGGRAARMKGRDKAFLKLGEETLIERQLGMLEKIFKEIIVVTNSPDKYRRSKGLRVIRDIIPHQGPLGAIFSGLNESGEKYNFIVACDMPFINDRLIKYMFEKSRNYDVVMPYIDDRYQTLFSVYSKNCLSSMSQMLDANDFKVSRLIKRIKVRKINRNEVLQFGSPEKIFMNINSKQDLSYARRIIRQI